MSLAIQDSIPDWGNQRLTDSGPVYAETGTGGSLFIVQDVVERRLANTPDIVFFRTRSIFSGS